MRGINCTPHNIGEQSAILVEYKKNKVPYLHNIKRTNALFHIIRRTEYNICTTPEEQSTIVAHQQKNKVLYCTRTILREHSAILSQHQENKVQYPCTFTTSGGKNATLAHYQTSYIK
jgi:hypothetical protein